MCFALQAAKMSKGNLAIVKDMAKNANLRCKLAGCFLAI